jgi:hypothetical protein
MVANNQNNNSNFRTVISQERKFNLHIKSVTLNDLNPFIMALIQNFYIRINSATLTSTLCRIIHLYFSLVLALDSKFVDELRLYGKVLLLPGFIDIYIRTFCMRSYTTSSCGSVIHGEVTNEVNSILALSKFIDSLTKEELESILIGTPFDKITSTSDSFENFKSELKAYLESFGFTPSTSFEFIISGLQALNTTFSHDKNVEIKETTFGYSTSNKLNLFRYRNIPDSPLMYVFTPKYEQTIKNVELKLFDAFLFIFQPTIIRVDNTTLTTNRIGFFEEIFTLDGNDAINMWIYIFSFKKPSNNNDHRNGDKKNPHDPLGKKQLGQENNENNGGAAANGGGARQFSTTTNRRNASNQINLLDCIVTEGLVDGKVIKHTFYSDYNIKSFDGVRIGSNMFRSYLNISFVSIDFIYALLTYMNNNFQYLFT